MNKPKLLRIDRQRPALEASPPALLTEENLQRFAEEIVAFERALHVRRSGSNAPTQPLAASLPTSLEGLRSESSEKCPLAIKSDKGA